MSVLMIKRGFNQGATFRLGVRVTTIGRGTTNWIQLVDDKVSRRHAVVRWTGTGHEVQDLDSVNGLWVNGARVARHDLRVGDMVTVGNTTLEVVPDAACREDSAMARKVADPTIVGARTQISTMEELIAAEPVTRPSTPVDTEEAWRRADDRQAAFLADLERRVGAGQGLQSCADAAVKGLLELAGADRAAVFRVAEGRVTPVAAAYGDLPAESAGARPYAPALIQALRSLNPVILNRVQSESTEQTRLATVAVVPIRVEGAAPGAIYLDSFADNPVAFIEEDFVLLHKAAAVVAGAFAQPVQAAPARQQDAAEFLRTAGAGAADGAGTLAPLPPEVSARIRKTGSLFQGFVVIRAQGAEDYATLWREIGSGDGPPPPHGFVLFPERQIVLP
ncbi:MAG: FHA domain-containing protein [Deltaproteobacteria bacterium]|nr:FHA domain-containing protein [Deltaproteobacteria bacterium]